MDGTQVVSLETFSDRRISIVRAKTLDGSVGYGQISTHNADISATVFHRQVAPHALGRSSDDVDSIVQDGLRAEYKFPGSYMCRALSGLDTALLDLRGRREGVSVARLLGGEERPVKVYGSSMRRDISPEEEADRLVRLRDEKGYEAFKIRIGSVNGNDADQWPGRTEELIKTVRERLPDDVRLFADANGCYTPKRAIEVGRLLQDYGFSQYEEPCPYMEIEWTRQVTSALDIPVSGGEQDYDINQWKRIVDTGAVGIVQPDIGYVGGIGRASRVAEMAAARGLLCRPHSANRSMVTLFTAHLVTSLANFGEYLEYSIEEEPFTRGLFSPELEVADGRVRISSEPGFGVEVSREWIGRAERVETRIQHLPSS